MSEVAAETIDVGYYPEFSQRVARSCGYAAGYDGEPQDRHLRFGARYQYRGADLDAWNEGWQRGSEIRAVCPPKATRAPAAAKPEAEVKRTATSLF